MLSICHSKTSTWGEHRLEWTATFDGGGYWRCLNAGCTEALPSNDDHHGG